MPVLVVVVVHLDLRGFKDLPRLQITISPHGSRGVARFPRLFSLPLFLPFLSRF